MSFARHAAHVRESRKAERRAARAGIATRDAARRTTRERRPLDRRRRGGFGPRGAFLDDDAYR